MKKNFNGFRIVASAITIVALLLQFCLPVLGTESKNNYQYDYSNIDAEFAEDRVLVVLTQEASLQFLEYTPESFLEIGCKDVIGMTPFIVNKAREAITEVSIAIQNKAEPTIDTRLNLSGFKNVLCLELDEPGKDNVLKAIDKLLERDDVLSAMPDPVRIITDTALMLLE